MFGYYNIFLLVLSLFTFTCKENDNLSNTEDIKSISQAKNKWVSLNIHNYSFKQTARTWAPWSPDTMLIIVRSDTVFNIINTKDGSQYEKNLWTRYKSVNQLFEIAQDTSSYTTEYEFDNTYGYPVNLFFKPKTPAQTEGGIRYFSTGLAAE